MIKRNKIPIGGDDLDELLVSVCLADFARKTAIDTIGNARASRRLMIQCERARRVLSKESVFTIEIEKLAGDTDFTFLLTRDRLVEICLPVLNQITELISDLLNKMDRDKKTIDHVVLVGGLLNMPYLEKYVKNYWLPKTVVHDHFQPDFVKVIGAVMLAAKIRGEDSSKALPIFKFQPVSIGIETAGGMMHIIVERNAQLPLKKTMKFATYADNNSHVLIRVYEGERALTKYCEVLSEFELRVPPKPRGSV